MDYQTNQFRVLTGGTNDDSNYISNTLYEDLIGEDSDARKGGGKEQYQ